ncbi:rhomboid family intramembrane serine protease [Hymenobacter cellulosilyticus]|uniref:Rhomboid family intramembrane serine protease n=1 Tax=Hymenobacter cellulosilyticus TaxID=2932248 RepID=A0A8T9QE92_9BACT|nr:rhomboid family intramembrane serine protease [Hymenobacter cellulosilyticus]UOQ74468.1 rhomboid family intramembrane serine protease [Hymenobacter cellulosilyticus]
MFNFTPTVRLLLFLNIGVLILQTQIPAVNMLALYPIGSPQFQPWQFVTHVFMHAGVGHLMSNMLGLLVFGPMLEERWGGNRFLTFWVICGIGAGMLYSGVRYYEVTRLRNDIEVFQKDPSDINLQDFVEHNLPQYRQAYSAVIRQLHATPDDQRLIQSQLETMQATLTASLRSPMLGASGALFGVLFAFAYLFPNTVVGFPFPIKAKYLVSIYALIELYSGIHRVPGDNVAHFAHLGGLLIGFIVLKFWERGRTRFY